MDDQRHCILIIDPDPSTCDLYQRALGGAFDLLTCHGAREGLGVLSAGAVDAVLLEPHHPQDADWSMAHTLARQSNALGIPLLVCSAVEVPQPDLLAATAYLTKPVSPTTILRLLRQCIAAAAPLPPHAGAIDASGTSDTKESHL